MILFIIFLNYLIFSPTFTWVCIGLLTLIGLYGSVFWLIRSSEKIHTDTVLSVDIRKKELQYTATSFFIFFGIVHLTFLGFEQGFLTFDFEMSA